jgi:N-acetylglutamate synthase-like GNAT family acetyltransferase
MAIIYTSELKNELDLYKLYNELDWNDFLKLDASQLNQAMEQSWLVIYAYDGDNLVGTGRIVSDSIINAYLCGLGVSNKYRNRGIGTEISRQLVDACKQNNLHIQFFCEKHLVTYYEKQGFVEFAVGMKSK